MILNNLSKMIVNCCTGNRTQQIYKCTNSDDSSAPATDSGYYSGIIRMGSYSEASNEATRVLDTRGLILGKGNTPPRSC